jgi:hypothetical protein
MLEPQPKVEDRVQRQAMGLRESTAVALRLPLLPLLRMEEACGSGWRHFQESLDLITEDLLCFTRSWLLMMNRPKLVVSRKEDLATSDRALRAIPAWTDTRTHELSILSRRT